MYIIVRGAIGAFVVTLILGVSIVLAIETPKATIVDRHVENIPVFVARHQKMGSCGLRPVRISDQGKDFIRQHEGLRLDQYYDRIGYAIGYGMHTWQGLPVTLTHPSSVTAADIEEEFATQLAVYARIVTRSVCMPLTVPMFDALVSVAWNTGRVNASIVQKADLGHPVDVADFLVTATTHGQQNPVLADRRLREYIMFTGDYDRAMDQQMPAGQLLQHFGN